MAQLPKPPSGLEPRTPGNAGFVERLTSSIIGTARFAAAMRKRVSVRTKLLVLALIVLVLAMVAGALYLTDSNQKLDAQLEDALLRGSPEDLTFLRDTLAEGLDDTRSLRVIRYLGQRRDAAAVPILTEYVSRGGQMLYEAAVALRRIGKPAALSARVNLEQALHKTTGAEHLAVALALAQLGAVEGQKIALAGLADGQLQQIEGYSAAEFGRALSPAVLVGALSSESDAQVIFATQTLAQRCTDAAEAGLTKLLDRPESEVVLASALALLRCFETTSSEAVATALRDGRIPRTEAVLAIDAEVGAPGYRVLLAVEQDAARRETLLRRLAKLGDPRSVPLLQQGLGDASLGTQTRLALLGALLSFDEMAALPWLQSLWTELKEGAGWDALLDLIATHATGDALVPFLVDAYKQRKAPRVRIGQTLAHLQPCGHKDIGKVTASLRGMTEALHAALELVGLCKLTQEQAWLSAAAKRSSEAKLEPDARRTFGLLMYAAVRLEDKESVSVLAERVLRAPQLIKHADEILWPALAPPAHEALLERVLGTALASLDTPERALPLIRAATLSLPASSLARALSLLSDGKADPDLRLAAAEAIAMSGHDLKALDVTRVETLRSLPAVYALLLESAPRSLQPMASLLTSASASTHKLATHLRSPLAPTRAMWGQSIEVLTRQTSFLFRLKQAGHPGLYEAWVDALVGPAGQAPGLPTQAGKIAALKQWSTGESESLRHFAFDGLVRLKLRGEALAAAADHRAPGHKEALQALSTAP